MLEKYMWAFKVFPMQGFFGSQLFRYDVLTKRISQPPNSQPQLHVGFVNAAFLGLFGWFMCNNVRREAGTPSLNLSNWHILCFSRGNFLDI